MSTVPNSASELYEIVTTGTGQDVVDAIEAMTSTHGEFLTELMMRSALNELDAEAGAPWVWEYSTLDGATVYDTEVFWDLPALKKAVDASFDDYTWEEVERRGMFGTSVLIRRNGRYVDTGHWVYRRPNVLPPWFPGEPGSQWRDVDNDVWTHADNGYLYMARRPGEPASPEIVQRKYGPMTPVGGDV